MLMRMVAVDPYELPFSNRMLATANANEAAPFETHKDFMSWKMVAADVMIRTTNEIPGPEHGVEDITMRRIWRRIE